MNNREAQEYVRSLKDQDGEWQDPCHIATFRLCVKDEFSYFSLCELRLKEPLPFGDFQGIFRMAQEGIWYYDRDVSGPAWRPILIPWGQMKALRFHRSTEDSPLGMLRSFEGDAKAFRQAT